MKHLALNVQWFMFHFRVSMPPCGSFLLKLTVEGFKSQQEGCEGLRKSFQEWYTCGTTAKAELRQHLKGQCHEKSC